MSFLCGWVSFKSPEAIAEVVQDMGNALRVHNAQRWEQWTVSELGIGLLEFDPNSAEFDYSPAVSPDSRWFLWLAGEVFKTGSGTFPESVELSRSKHFREYLLHAYLKDGEKAIRDLDGEFHIVLWDSAERTLKIINDRFGGIPLYWSSSSEGFAFAAGVRGVLMAPGISAEPDSLALKEALTFGGFRLGDRTNVVSVKMFSAATISTLKDGQFSSRRYWSWKDIPAFKVTIPEAVECLHELWSQAIEIRLRNTCRPGQTLSGGLDSRLILAEAAPKVPKWTAITYGLYGCDDAHYAQAAIAETDATWVFYPLYSGRNPDWLDLRSSFIQETDGLIQLGDLMHLETLQLQAKLIDTHVSGYIGDAVIGPTFNDVTTPEDALYKMPYYGPRFDIKFDDGVNIMRELAKNLDGAPLRFILFDHKLPQSTNRWTAAWRPWFRVRKPFTDYAFFDFSQGLQPSMRGKDAIYEHWLVSCYSRFFRSIPNQKTGMPILTPNWRLQTVRAGRYAWRKLLQPSLVHLGYPAKPRKRYYTSDDLEWSKPTVRQRLEATILRKGSISCEIFGRDAVKTFLSDWFDHVAAPAQAVGAMYVYEAYHRDLPAFLCSHRRPSQ